MKRDYMIGFMVSSLIIGLGLGFGLQLIIVFEYSSSDSFKVFCFIFDGLLIFFFIEEIVRRVGGLYDYSSEIVENKMKMEMRDLKL